MVIFHSYVSLPEGIHIDIIDLKLKHPAGFQWLIQTLDSNENPLKMKKNKIEVIEKSKLKFEPVSWTFQTIRIEIKVKKEA
jgi:hypothetical protein